MSKLHISTKDTVSADLGLLSEKERALERSSNDSSSRSSSSESCDETVRGNWSGRLDFLLSCIGFAIGLGNIWRFPYLCYKNGGGAFLIPYFMFLLLCGVPLFFMEVSFGQFCSLSPITIWKICPLFKGVGYGMVIISAIVCVYYNVIITWTIYYLYHSIRAVLPWSMCNNGWNTDQCYVRTRINDTSDVNSSVTLTANVSVAVGNITKRMTASEEFWERHVLQRTNGIDDLGEIRWDLLICLTVAWVVIFLCLCKGVKSSGKVVYVTATFPYLVLLILLVRGLTLPGAADGIKFYLIPDFSKLTHFQVWGDAAVQIFYSAGPAWGGLITMASYNKFHNNCYRDAMIVPFINCGTSIFAGLVIFSVLGYMAHETGVDIANVVTHGPGLAFVAYPEAMTTLPISPLWAVLFFLMLFTVGLDTQLCNEPIRIQGHSHGMLTDPLKTYQEPLLVAPSSRLCLGLLYHMINRISYSYKSKHSLHINNRYFLLPVCHFFKQWFSFSLFFLGTAFSKSICDRKFVLVCILLILE